MRWFTHNFSPDIQQRWDSERTRRAHETCLRLSKTEVTAGVVNLSDDRPYYSSLGYSEELQAFSNDGHDKHRQRGRRFPETANSYVILWTCGI